MTFRDPAQLLAASLSTKSRTPSNAVHPALHGFDLARITADLGVEIVNKERVLEREGRGQWIDPAQVCGHDRRGRRDEGLAQD
jgi:hypothetical protein